MTSAEYRKARGTLNLSQAELAAMLGVTRATVNRRENIEGRVTPEAELAIKTLLREKKK
jgi:DNA-binding XRE family transcriptional regulator